MNDDWQFNIIHPEDTAHGSEVSDGKGDETVVEARKPRLVLMGEFSAGKSTLTNVLLDSQPLPMKVTATRLPPVHITQGSPAVFAVGIDGQRTEIALTDLDTVPLEETAYIEVQMEAEVLTLCDIVDMPGISDPNMPQEMWENVIKKTDCVVWCTHATQAWRQSEAAIWKILKDQSSGSNLLLITQFDKLRTERDKNRVLQRVRRETDGLFDAVYPVSLLSALAAGEDYEVWKASGAADFSEHVIRILMQHAGPGITAAPQANDLRHPSAERIDLDEAMPAEDAQPRVAPRRIAAHASVKTARRLPRDASILESHGQ